MSAKVINNVSLIYYMSPVRKQIIFKNIRKTIGEVAYTQVENAILPFSSPSNDFKYWLFFELQKDILSPIDIGSYRH